MHNTIDPLRVIFRRAVRRDEITVDPTDGPELPAVRGKRDRIEAPDHAEKLIAALPEAQRALWTMAFFVGLRSGELRALRCSDLDLKAGVVNLKHGWDDDEGEIDVKSDAGCRTIPLAGVVRKELAAHLLREGRSGDDLVFGRTPTLPFVRSTVRARALRAWKAANDKTCEDAEKRGEKLAADALLRPLTPHEARHCAISYFIACGYDWKQATVFAGHSDVRTTYNRYAKVIPGGEGAAAAKLDAYLTAVASR